MARTERTGHAFRNTRESNTTATSPSWETINNEHGANQYRNVRCMSCNTALKPVHQDFQNPDGTWNTLQARDALRLTLTGGYGELLDTWDTPQEGYLCLPCTQNLAHNNPWLAHLIAGALNINIGHTCNDTLTWTPEPACTSEPDKHGWRPVWVLTSRDGNRTRFDTANDAERAQARSNGTITTSIIAHTRNLPQGSISPSQVADRA